jgi:hypothetical protein
VQTHLANATKPNFFVEFDNCYYVDPQNCEPINLQKRNDGNETL